MARTRHVIGSLTRVVGGVRCITMCGVTVAYQDIEKNVAADGDCKECKKVARKYNALDAPTVTA